MIPEFYLDRQAREPQLTDDEERLWCKGMRHVVSKSSNESTESKLPARFVFGTELGKSLLRRLQIDAQGAKLPSSFRFYYRLRSLIPIWLRQLLQSGRNRNMTVDEHWYLPQSFVEEFKSELQEHNRETLVLHPWPDGFDMAAVLTHDVETKEGMARVLQLAEIEAEYGLVSCWNLIPHKYEVDIGIVEELQRRGHEVGVHGFNHDGRLFESYDTFRSRTKPINAAIERFGSSGFRAPMVHRNLLWLQELDIDYDASCFDIDPFQAMAGGVGGVWPFFVGKFVELPYTLPQDHTLFVALGDLSPRIWIEKFNWLSELHGMALLVTHPDYLNSDQRLNAYRQLLEYLMEQRDHCWFALPHEAATWWRIRDGMEIVKDDGNPAQIVGSANERASVATLEELFPRLLADG